MSGHNRTRVVVTGVGVVKPEVCRMRVPVMVTSSSESCCAEALVQMPARMEVMATARRCFLRLSVVLDMLSDM